MPALGCQSVTDSFSPLARRSLLPGAVFCLAAVLNACAPLAPSTQGAIATGLPSHPVVQGMHAPSSVDLAHAAPTVPHFRDPLAALQKELAAQVQEQEQEELPDVDQQGIASWYGPGFHGRRTANGERYNQYDLTAAHPNFAFGTQLCVRNAANGRTVMVRVNDRGPFAKNRVIDLSKAAAEEIGMLGKGIKKVEIYKLNPDDEDCPSALQAPVLEARR